MNALSNVADGYSIQVSVSCKGASQESDSFHINQCKQGAANNVYIL